MTEQQKTFGFVDQVRHDLHAATHVASQKGLQDFAGLTVETRFGGPHKQPANWQHDLREFVKHYSGSTYIAIGAIARKVAMQEAQVLVRTKDKSGEKLEPVDQNHPLVELFREVNPIMTEYDLWFYTIAWRLNTGNSYWWKVRNGLQVPAEIWPIPSPWVRAIPSRTEYISDYQVRGMFEKPVLIPAADIVHMREPNLDWSGTGRFYGQPVTSAGATMVDVEESMLTRLLNHFRNYAPPGLHYMTEEPLTEEQLTDIYQQIQIQHSLAEQTGRPVVSHSGMKLVADLTMDAREMDYRGSLDTALEYQLAIYGVPKAVVGLVKDTNRANMHGALMAFAENTINPLLRHIGQHLTQHMAREFDERLVVMFKPVTVEDSERIRKDMEFAQKAGALTPNEIRETLFEESAFKVGGERPVIPSTMGQADYGNEEPPEPEEPQEAQPAQPAQPEIPQADAGVEEGNGAAHGGKRPPRGGAGRQGAPNGKESEKRISLPERELADSMQKYLSHRRRELLEMFDEE